MNDIWKDVDGYDGVYQVSQSGKVRNTITKHISKDKKNNRGYVQIRLYKNGRCDHWLLHRLVAASFISNLDNLPQINHKDENKENNNFENLEWCTNTYNRHYGTGIDRMAANRNQMEIGKKVSKQISQLDRLGNIIKTFYGVKEAERQTGVTESNIRRSMRFNYCAGGYRWLYT